MQPEENVTISPFNHFTKEEIIVSLEWEKLCVSCAWTEHHQYYFLSFIWRVASKATDIGRQDRTIICVPFLQSCWIRISYVKFKICMGSILTWPSISISTSSVWGRPKAAMFPIRWVSSRIASTYGISRRCLLETSFSWPLWKIQTVEYRVQSRSFRRNSSVQTKSIKGKCNLLIKGQKKRGSSCLLLFK